MTRQELFGDLDFKLLADDTSFKEASVREFIILPIINQLGYTSQDIILEKSVQVQSGSKKQPTTIFADYVLRIGEYFVCVIEAKAPQKNINNAEIIEQAFSYASHSSIRSNYFVLCNGVEFVLYKTDIERTKLLQFQIEDIEENWEKLERYLRVDSFTKPETTTKHYFPQRNINKDFDYKNRPLLKEIPVRKGVRRYHGVHAYFTSQPWNVVQTYIKHYTQPGDLVLDPFGGKGVTAIEAMMTERRAINIDLNPFAIFLVEALVSPVNTNELFEVFEKIKKEYTKLEPKTKTEINEALKKYEKQLPKDLSLPKSSDVDSVLKLFSKEQLAKLALLKSLIKKQKNKNIQISLMIMFLGLVTRYNLTAHSPKMNHPPSGGDAAAFKYYRYRIAPHTFFIDFIEAFELRCKRVIEAKKEMEFFINTDTIENINIRKGSATDLSFLDNESVDYIYTDPPYGKKIPYLDLSTMWNAWLDLDVTEEDYKLEAIEGGEHNKSKQEYNDLISKSIQEMFRVLKWDRWMSFVFAHKDPEFWHLIVDTAEKSGFEYIGAVPQKTGVTSFKKAQNPFTVLSGQLIISFRKTTNPKAIMKANLGMDISEIVMQSIEGVIAKNNGATIEQINDELIIRGLELGFLDLLKKEYSDLTPILTNNFDYNTDTELFYLRKDSKFKTQVSVELRIKYYLISYMRRIERAENRHLSFDEIVLYVMPLLKNGKTPDEQTIQNVLEGIAEKVSENEWKLSDGELF